VTVAADLTVGTAATIGNGGGGATLALFGGATFQQGATLRSGTGGIGLAGGTVSVTAGDLVFEDAVALTGTATTLTVAAGSATFTGDVTTGGRDLTATATNIRFAGGPRTVDAGAGAIDLNGTTTVLAATGALTLTGATIATDEVETNGQNLTANGATTFGGDVTATGAVVDVNGALTVAAGRTLTAATVDVSGNLAGQGALTVAGTLTVGGTTTTTGGGLDVSGAATLWGDATIAGAFQAASLVLQGADRTVQAHAITVSGDTNATHGATLTATAGDLQLGGALTTIGIGGAATFSAAGTLTISGDLTATGAVTLRGNTARAALERAVVFSGGGQTIRAASIAVDAEDADPVVTDAVVAIDGDATLRATSGDIVVHDEVRATGTTRLIARNDAGTAGGNVDLLDRVRKIGGADATLEVTAFGDITLGRYTDPPDNTLGVGGVSAEAGAWTTTLTANGGVQGGRGNVLLYDDIDTNDGALAINADLLSLQTTLTIESGSVDIDVNIVANGNQTTIRATGGGGTSGDVRVRRSLLGGGGVGQALTIEAQNDIELQEMVGRTAGNAGNWAATLRAGLVGDRQIRLTDDAGIDAGTGGSVDLRAGTIVFTGDRTVRGGAVSLGSGASGTGAATASASADLTFLVDNFALNGTLTGTAGGQLSVRSITAARGLLLGGPSEDGARLTLTGAELAGISGFGTATYGLDCTGVVGCTPTTGAVTLAAGVDFGSQATVAAGDTATALGNILGTTVTLRSFRDRTDAAPVGISLLGDIVRTATTQESLRLESRSDISIAGNIDAATGGRLDLELRSTTATPENRIRFESSGQTLVDVGSGRIELAGFTSANGELLISAEEFDLASGSDLNVDESRVTIETNRISLGGVLRGTGVATIRTRTASQDINLGSGTSGATEATSLRLDNAELANIRDFGRLIIGARSSAVNTAAGMPDILNTGAVTIDGGAQGASAALDPLVFGLTTEVYGGSITVAGAVRAAGVVTDAAEDAGDAALTFGATGDVTIGAAGRVTTGAGQDIAISTLTGSFLNAGGADGLAPGAATAAGQRNGRFRIFLAADDGGTQADRVQLDELGSVNLYNRQDLSGAHRDRGEGPLAPGQPPRDRNATDFQDAVTTATANLATTEFTTQNLVMHRWRPTLTIQAQTAAPDRFYGHANPALGYTVAGLRGGDTAATALASAAAGTGGRSTGVAVMVAPGLTAPVRFADINGNGRRDPGEEIAYDGDIGQIQGDARWVDADGDGLVDPGELLAFDAVTGQFAGVRARAVSRQGYELVFETADLTVDAAPLTVSPADQRKTYGSQNLDFTNAPSTHAVFDGLRNDETASVLTGDYVYTTPTTLTSPVLWADANGNGRRDAGEQILSRQIALAPGSTLYSRNYDITYGTGRYFVDPAALRVIAIDAARVVGLPNPPIRVRYEGFVLGQDPSVLFGTVGVFTQADATSPVGDYALEPFGLEADNYEIEFVDGTLSIVLLENEAERINLQSVSLGSSAPVVPVNQLPAETALAAAAQNAAFASAVSQFTSVLQTSGDFAEALSVAQGFTNEQRQATFNAIPMDDILTGLENSGNETAREAARVIRGVLDGRVDFASARTALEELGVGEEEARTYLALVQRAQREARSRAYGQALGDIEGALAQAGGSGIVEPPRLDQVTATVIPGTGVRVLGRLEGGGNYPVLRVNGLWVFVDDEGNYDATVPPDGDGRVVVTVEDEVGSSIRREVALTSAQLAALGEVAQDAEPAPRRIAVVIANSDYQDPNIVDLGTPQADADLISRTLEARFGFETRLIRDGTRTEIMDGLRDLGRELREQDQVVVYYAGHGYSFYGTDLAFWLPADAAVDRANAWISSAELARVFHRMPARQILLVADSCYSGGFAADGLRGAVDGNLADVRFRRSVMALTSGGDEPVEDGSTNSPFAAAFARHLQALDGPTTVSSVFDRVHAEMNATTPQSPNYGAVLFAGYDRGGDFVLYREGERLPGGRAAPAGASAAPTPAAGDGAATGSGAPPAAGPPDGA